MSNPYVVTYKNTFGIIYSLFGLFIVNWMDIAVLILTPLKRLYSEPISTFWFSWMLMLIGEGMFPSLPIKNVNHCKLLM